MKCLIDLYVLFLVKLKTGISNEFLSILSHQPLYCGSISDKELFIKSHLMDVLEPNDIVMADKGFQIEQELQIIGHKLKYPKFLKYYSV
ncbi:uncharacterized protein LOC129975529 [Argiope bruennichi]|uniref:uncharacterized protein LOC129975529 n=1 Tax=Argiope bruennichi TaxID=94029 RepID=UPI0024945FB7|nr:uncharacterized protein LOC129975529 [Argiope bruennichi]